ncbi:MAG: DUF935 family protein [Elusimicrobiales bacterium]|nr:DUF935 family protein [Elusimicrobiales bacterium]
MAELLPKDKYKTGGKLDTGDLDSLFKSPYYDKSYQFPYNPDPLCPSNNYSTYDEMRKDDQVKAVLNIKKSIIIGNGWQVVCDNKEIKEYVENNLKTLNEDSIEETFEESVNDMLSAFDYGFSLTECVYKIISGKYLINKLRVRPPHTFRFEMDVKGNVTEVIQSGETDLPFKPSKFIHYAHQMEFGNPYGLSDLNSAYLPWKIKKFFVKMWAKYGERFGTPTIHGKFEDGANKEDIDAFFDIMESMQNNTVLATPKSAEVEFIFAGKEASDLYDNAIDKFNLWIARSILVPDLLGLSGSKTEGGSFALGQKQFDLFLATIKKDRNMLAKKITRRVIMPMVNANWGEVECDFEFMPYTDGDETELSKLWLEAVKTKAWKPTDDEINNFRKIVKYPEGEIERIEEQSDPFGGRLGLKGGPQDGTGPLGPKKETPAEKEKREEKEFTKKELTSYEKKMDFPRIKRDLDKADKTISARVLKITDKMIDSIINQINKDFNIKTVNKLKVPYQKEMNKIFTNSYTDLFHDAFNTAQKEIFPNGDKNYTDANLLPDEFIEIIEIESFKNVGDYSTGLIKKTTNILATGIKNGVAQAVIVADIIKINKSYSVTWVNAVVRTKTNDVYNSARKIYWETDPLASQIVEAYQYSAILDSRTSAVCEELHGKKFKKGEYMDRICPPNHMSCRSQLVPITKFEDYKVDRQIPISKLQKDGGHLIYEKPLIATGYITAIGNTVLIDTPKERLKILSIYISNLDDKTDCEFDLRDDLNGVPMYPTRLHKNGGEFRRKFEDWTLEPMKALYISSSGANLGFTCEYIIVNELGGRVE